MSAAVHELDDVVELRELDDRLARYLAAMAERFGVAPDTLCEYQR